MPEQPQDIADDFNAYVARDEKSDASAAGEEPQAETAGESETPDDQEQAASSPNPKEDEEDDKPEDDGEEEKPRRRSGLQKRFDKLTREKRELEERVAALEKSKPPAEEPKAEADGKSPAAKKPAVDDFDTYEEYTEALTDWKLEQRLGQEERKRAEAEAKARQDAENQRLAKSYEESVSKFTADHPDFQKVVSAAEDVYLPPHMHQALLDAGPNAAAMVYHLAKNPEEAERIAKLPESSCLRELGRLEAKLEAAPAPKPKPVSAAPKPVKAVSGDSRAPTLEDVGTDFEAYQRMVRNRRT